MSKGKKVLWITLIVLFVIVVGDTVGFFVYTSIYYHADQGAIVDFCDDYPDVKVEPLGDKGVVVKGEEIKAGVVFYPGAKVESKAYLPLCAALAQRGYATVLLNVPFRLAVLSPNRADGVQKALPEADRWYLAGHSLGGTIACHYAARHPADFDGVILLASFSDKDLSQTSLTVLSIYGDQDKVLNRRSYDNARSRYPSDFDEYVIEGGCHAGFGMYGAQKGDGTPTIDSAAQITLTADYIAAKLG